MGLRRKCLSSMGPSIKYVTLEGKGVRDGVTVCDRGGGKDMCDITHFFNHIQETDIGSDASLNRMQFCIPTEDVTQSSSHTHTHIHTYIHACIHTYIHTYIHYIYTYMYACSYIHTYIHTYIELSLGPRPTVSKADLDTLEKLLHLCIFWFWILITVSNYQLL